MDRDELYARCHPVPRLVWTQAETLVRMLAYRRQHWHDEDFLLTPSVARALGAKALVYNPMHTYKGMKSCCLTAHGARVVGLILIAAQLAAQEQAHG